VESIKKIHNVIISQLTHLTSGTIPYPSKDSQPIWNFDDFDDGLR